MPETGSAEFPVERWTRGSTTHTSDRVALEMPVALVYHSVPHVVMLATPADLEDFATGFTLSEGLVGEAREIQSVEVEYSDEAIDVRVGISGERFSQMLERRRNLTGRTGCGLCGAETLEQAFLALTGSSIRDEGAGSIDQMRNMAKIFRGGRR